MYKTPPKGKGKDDDNDTVINSSHDSVHTTESERLRRELAAKVKAQADAEKAAAANQYNKLLPSFKFVFLN